MRGALLCLLAGCCLAVPVTRAQPLVFAFNTAEPYKVLDPAGQPAGAYVDIIRELARRSQLVLQIEPVPLKRVLVMLEQGSADIAIGIKGGPDRDGYLTFLDPPFAPSSRTIVLQRAADRRKLQRYEDLLPLRVGVVEGVHYFPQFDSDTRIRRDAAMTVDAALRKLQAKRFDVLMINSLQAQGELRIRGRAALFRHAPLSFEFGEPRRIAISRHTPHRAVLSAQLAGMVKDGTVRRLLAKTDAQIAASPLP
jgi:polar amino acid transport system substrate-binding protein